MLRCRQLPFVPLSTRCEQHVPVRIAPSEAMRQGLQEVLVHCDDRLVQIEEEHEQAVGRVADAMCQLESLSNELHGGEGRERSRRLSGV